MKEKINLTNVLAFLGTVPMVFCLVLLLFGIRQFSIFGAVETVFTTYVLVIASFMSGCYWGLVQSSIPLFGKKLLLLSNLGALFIWFAYVLCGVKLFLLLSLFLFLFYLLLDSLLCKKKIIASSYLALRKKVTLIVCVCLILGACVV
jgi:hypothetical protein